MQTLSLTLLVLLSVASVHSAQTVQQYINDNHVLNYALTLENLEAALYNQGIAKFGSNDAQYTAAGFPAGTYAALQLIATQETGHANTLTAVLGARGWPAVPVCTYNFSSAYTSVGQFVSTLAYVENLGTQAYDFASQGLTNADLLQTAAGIATVEGRHTAILQTLTNTSFNAPFPYYVDPGATPSTVFGAASGFIVSCPNNNISVPSLGGTFYNVISSDPTTFAFQNSAQVRGNTTVLPMASGFYDLTTPAGQAAAANDFAVLNYALTLEYLEAFFYANFSAAYSVANIQAINANANASLINQSISLIAAHEAYHVSFLQGVLKSGATQQCTYNFAPLGIAFGSTNFTQFITVAGALENKGVAAYVGAIRLLTNPYVATIAAGVATVEARHASYINNVRINSGAIYGPNGAVRFSPDNINTQSFNDIPATPTDVVTFLTTGSTPIISNCPANNPPVYGLSSNVKNTAQDFFNDNSANFLAPFVPPTVTSPAAAGASTTTTPANRPTPTAASSTVTFGFAVLVLAAFML